jgi:hypothetical protein
MRVDFDVQLLEENFQEYYPDFSFKEDFKALILNHFSRLGKDTLNNIMLNCCENTDSAGHAVTFFSDFCWRKLGKNDFSYVPLCIPMFLLENWDYSKIERRGNYKELSKETETVH